MRSIASRPGDLLVVTQLLFQQRDAFEHVEVPREGSGTEFNLSRMNAQAVACPDKFRGSLDAAAAAAAMARGLRTAGFEDVVEVPLADGGEGTLDALLAGARWVAPYRVGHRTARRSRSTRSGAGSPTAPR